MTGAGRPRVGACLSLTGRYARFGRQAARGLAAWRSLDGAAVLDVEDDRSDPGTLEAVLPHVAARCDLLLGPYSTRLARTAGRLAAGEGWLVWNHGGSGDDVQAAHPGHVVSVPAPAGRYADPFLRHLAAAPGRAVLWISHGRGSFGRQAAAGAEAAARRHGIRTVRAAAARDRDDRASRGGPIDLPPGGPPSPWDLFTAGSFEEDIETLRWARALPRPPRAVCSVAAGVREFARAAGVAGAEGAFGVGQWFPGAAPGPPQVGPDEDSFLAAYAAAPGPAPGGPPGRPAAGPAAGPGRDQASEPPDYPAVQAAAAAALAVHCARRAGGTSREGLWAVASALDTRTLFGRFRIRAEDGVQAGHGTVLVRWSGGRPALLPPGPPGAPAPC